MALKIRIEPTKRAGFLAYWVTIYDLSMPAFLTPGRLTPDGPPECIASFHTWTRWGANRRARKVLDRRRRWADRQDALRSRWRYEANEAVERIVPDPIDR